MANDWKNKPVNSSGYRDGMDYSLAIRNATSDAEVKQLQAERQNKINAEYGGSDPYKNVNTSSSYGSNWNPQTTTAAGSAAYRGVQNTVNSGGTASSEQITASNATWDNPTGLAAVNANTAPVAGMASVYDQSIMSAADAERIVQLSQLAKEAYASGNPNAVYHQEAEALRAKYGYSGGDMGDEYIPLKQEVDVPKVQSLEPVNTGRWGDYLDQWLSSAQQQQVNKIDYATNQAVQDLIRQQQDAQGVYQEQRNQIAIDEAKAKDNQALYAEARGDKGGIGQAQYDQIMATAAQNRLAVNQAQTKLATDTARQIADLRAQGEYEKADALLQLSQQYLSQLINLEQWAMEYNLSVAQFNEAVRQWEAEYKMQEASITGYYKGAPTLQYQQYQDELALAQQERLAEDGWILLNAGIPPAESQLAAMGITRDQAQSYITAAQLAAAQKAKSGGGSGGGGGEDSDISLTTAKMYAENGIFNDAVIAAFKKNGWDDTLINAEYPDYQDSMQYMKDYDVTNRMSGDGTKIYVSGMGYIDPSEISKGLDSGLIVAAPDHKNKTVTYTYNRD